MLVATSFSQKIFAQDAINLQWLDLDRSLFNEVRPVLLEMKDYNSLKRNYGFIEDESEEIGFGYSLKYLTRSGGTTSIYIKLLTNINNTVLRTEIAIYSNEQYFRLINSELNITAIPNIIKIDNYTYRTKYVVEFMNDKLYNSFLHDFNNYFGIENIVIVPDIIKNEYELLTDPFCEGVYGKNVGISGKIPEMRIALNKIVSINNNEILIKILTSSNPVGRIYAIEGLFKGNINKINNKNQYTEILNKVAALNSKVTVGFGCILHSETIDSVNKIKQVVKYFN